jgi:hypothetical protein
MTAAQKELLLWHHKWAHADTQRCQAILSKPREDGATQMIKPRHKKASACRQPLCAACQLGKQGQTSVRASTQVLLPNCQNLLRQGNLKPGDAVSIDQYMSATHGRLAHTKGKEAKLKQYVGGTIFVDHATTLIHHSSQVSLRVGETLKAKHRFEGLAREWGHQILRYHADNAPFCAMEFVQDCTNQNQKVSYLGVGAHHQNGVAERAIRTVTSWARTMMLHQVKLVSTYGPTLSTKPYTSGIICQEETAHGCRPSNSFQGQNFQTTTTYNARTCGAVQSTYWILASRTAKRSQSGNPVRDAGFTLVFLNNI